MKVSVIILFIALIAASAARAQVAKGYVFDDINKNGLFDKNEKGIPGVLVSNQEKVVKTDASGFYSLELNDPCVLFITQPSGYRVPTNSTNLPQFYYIYQPGGSPALEHPGIRPTGPLPEFVNFPLQKVAEPEKFNMLVVADVQAASETELGYFRDDVVAPALLRPFDFAISLGDLIHDNPSLFAPYSRSIALLNKPFYNVLGNHDVNYDATETYADDSFKNSFGPQYYSFDHGQVHFVVLENVERFCKKGDVAAYWDCYRGKVGEQQLTWLKNDLALVPTDKMVVVCQHIAFEKKANPGERNEVVNMKEVFDILKQRDNLLILAGHKHTLQHDFFGADQGWEGKTELRQIVCSSASGSWWTGPKDERGIPSSTQIDGVPNGYFIFSFDGTKVIPAFYPAGPNPEQMRIEKPLGKINSSQKEIIVNVYNSNRNSSVVALVDGKTEVALSNTPMKDPFITQSFKEYRAEYKSWASPAESTQIWTGSIPAGLEKGFHQINIQTKDDCGNVFTSSCIFEIE